MKPITQEWINKAEGDWREAERAAVDYRYPGKSATKADAKQAIKDCREIRRAVRTAFGLPI